MKGPSLSNTPVRARRDPEKFWPRSSQRHVFHRPDPGAVHHILRATDLSSTHLCELAGELM